jgi:hypothetical protein
LGKIDTEGQLLDVDAVADHEGEVLVVTTAANLKDLQIQHWCQDAPIERHNELFPISLFCWLAKGIFYTAFPRK